MANSNFRKQTPLLETVSNCQEKASLDFYITNFDFNQTQMSEFQSFDNKLQFSNTDFRKQTPNLDSKNRKPRFLSNTDDP